MKQGTPALLGLLFCLFQPFFLSAQWTNGQNAAFVIGQPDFSTYSTMLSQNGLDDPEAIAVDLINHKLYVADGNHNRVLRYSLPITSNQPNAEMVFGQPDFTTSNPNTSQNGLNDPRGLWVDLEGRLWVVENANHRVVWFNKAYAITSNQPNADGVLGQPDFISNSTSLTQNSMYAPCDVVVDAIGNLWITDAGNDRVLRFDTAAAKMNGANADGVLGQVDFTSNITQTSQDGLDDPEGIALGSNGTLWVSDDNNHRVLGYDNALAKPNGGLADRVLGQANFLSNSPNTSQNGMDGSSGLTFDCFDNLYVADKNNERVLVFLSVLSKGNGGNADFVIGQTNFSSGSNGNAQNRLNLSATSGMSIYGDQLFIADKGNQRVIVQKANRVLTDGVLCGLIEKPLDPIPTLSEWGLLIIALLLLNLGLIGIHWKNEVIKEII